MVISCSDGPANGSDKLEECNSDLSVSVSDGTTPTFTWEPECRAFFLGVVNKDTTPSDMWRFASFSIGNFPSNNLPSGVEYGILPDGFEEGSDLIVEPIPLVSGTLYEVSIYWLTDPHRDLEDFEDLEDTTIYAGPFSKLFIP